VQTVQTVQTVRRARPFFIDAWVVLPDHLHCLWTLPPGDDDTSTRWRLIKTFFVGGLTRSEWRSAVRMRRGERGIWQRRFWEHAILDDADYAAHVDSVHFNPAKHRLVASPAEWPYSTFRSCAERGHYPLDWIGAVVEDVPAGEPGGLKHASDYA